METKTQDEPTVTTIKYVTYIAPLTSVDGDISPIFVSINGKDFLIKRGEEVIIPDYVFEVLKESTKQSRAYANMLEKYVAKSKE